MTEASDDVMELPINQNVTDHLDIIARKFKASDRKTSTYSAIYLASCIASELGRHDQLIVKNRRTGEMKEIVINGKRG